MVNRLLDVVVQPLVEMTAESLIRMILALALASDSGALRYT